MYICIYIYMSKYNCSYDPPVRCHVLAGAGEDDLFASRLNVRERLVFMFIYCYYVYFLLFSFFYFFLFLLNVREKHMYVCSYKNNMYVKMRVCSYICMQLFKCMYVNIYIYVYMYVCPGKTYACINTTCRMSMKNHQLDISRQNIKS